MSNEVMKNETKTPVPFTKPNEEQILKSDIVIPKVLQCQALSKVVVDGTARAGDIVRSSNAQVLGGKDKPLEFIPLSFQNLWMISSNEIGDNRTFKFKGYEPRTSANESEEWEFFENGVKCKRTKVMNVFALLPSDIEAQMASMKKFQETGELPDLDSVILPVVIPFRNTSFKAAKEVATLFIKAESLARDMKVDVPVYGRTMRLSNVMEKNDKGQFYVLKVEAAGPTKKEYVEQCAKWRATLLQMGKEVKIDDADVASDAEEPAKWADQF